MSSTSLIVRRTKFLAVALAAALTMAACSSGTSKSGGAAPKGSNKAVATATIAVQSAPRSMDIAHANDYPSQRAISAAFDRMVALDSEGKVIPWIAKSWTQPDPTTYVFKIRTDVKFWDGTALTSKDVAFSLSRHLVKELGSEVAGQFSAVKSAEATDASTVTVTLNSASSGFLQTAAVAWTIMSEKYATDSSGRPRHSDQAGPRNGALLHRLVLGHRRGDAGTIRRLLGRQALSKDTQDQRHC